jgi:hypothetical protein
LPVALGVLALGFVASSCSSNAAAQGDEACRYVHSSLRLFSASLHDAKDRNHRAANQESSQALTDLRLALPLAAQAAGSDGNWQPLMATLSESNRVPEVNLVDALSQQCAGIS